MRDQPLRPASDSSALGIMRRFVIPFAVGFGVATRVFVLLVLPRVSQERVEFGRRSATTTTKVQFLNLIHQELGNDYRDSDSTNAVVLFEVKDARVVVVDRDGIKTLRVR